MIDFCVVVNGINLDVMVPLFFETLEQKCNTDGTNNMFFGVQATRL